MATKKTQKPTRPTIEGLLDGIDQREAAAEEARIAAFTEAVRKAMTDEIYDALAVAVHSASWASFTYGGQTYYVYDRSFSFGQYVLEVHSESGRYLCGAWRDAVLTMLAHQRKRG